AAAEHFLNVHSPSGSSSPNSSEEPSSISPSLSPLSPAPPSGISRVPSLPLGWPSPVLPIGNRVPLPLANCGFRSSALSSSSASSASPANTNASSSS